MGETTVFLPLPCWDAILIKSFKSDQRNILLPVQFGVKLKSTLNRLGEDNLGILSMMYYYILIEELLSLLSIPPERFKAAKIKTI